MNTVVSEPNPPEADGERRRRNRRTALWLLALALAFYVGFIVLSVTSGHK